MGFGTHRWGIVRSPELSVTKTELIPIDVPDMEEFNTLGKLILSAEATEWHRRQPPLYGTP